MLAESHRSQIALGGDSARSRGGTGRPGARACVQPGGPAQGSVPVAQASWGPPAASALTKSEPHGPERSGQCSLAPQRHGYS